MTSNFNREIVNFAKECDCLQEVILRILVFKNLGLSFEHMGFSILFPMFYVHENF